MQTLQISDQAAEQLNIMAAQERISSRDLIERLIIKHQQETEVRARREKALTTLEKHQGLYDGAPFNRDELHERP